MGAPINTVYRVLAHPTRVKILMQMTKLNAEGTEKWSPVMLAKELDESLANVSYHTKRLLDASLIEPAGEVPRRGAVEHYYTAIDGVEGLLTSAAALDKAITKTDEVAA